MESVTRMMPYMGDEQHNALFSAGAMRSSAGEPRLCGAIVTR